MNKYQAIFQGEAASVSEPELSGALEHISSWEDGYRLCKTLMARNGSVSDEKLIETFEYCFFMGLSIANKEAFFDANECLAKLYIRYGMYSEAAAKLLVLAYNFDCPDWVHLYLATTQLYTTFARIAEEPKFFFARLLAADITKPETKAEVRSVFANYLCLIVEQQFAAENVACEEIIQFAESICATATDEFRIFHQAICPQLPYKIVSDAAAEVSAAQQELEKAKAEAQKSQAEAARFKESAALAQQAAKAAKQAAEKYQAEAVKSKAAASAIKRDAEKAQAAAAQLQAAAAQAKQEAQKLEAEKSALAASLAKLEQEKQTALQPQCIDDVFLKMADWLNVSLRRYLAQWLTLELTKVCRNDFWSKKVQPALPEEVQAKFSTYKELTDFAIDVLLNIYYYNLNDFHPHSSMAKTTDRACIKEMKQIRNRWVGHFEENSWTKAKMLADIDTVIMFVEQIEMPREKQKEYIDFRARVAGM